MLGIFSMSVILQDDWVKEIFELLICCSGSGVDTDSRINILASREDASLKGHTECIRLVMVLVPNSLGTVLADERFSSCWELWK
jgi:hypothetical protein